MTSDAVRIGVSSIDAAADAGAAPESADLAFDGTVLQVSQTSFTARLSGPEGAAETFRVTVDAPGLDLAVTIAPGALAHVHYAHRCSTLGCESDILVTSLAELDGTANPAPSPSGLYIAADDGGGLMPDTPFSVDHVRLSCVTDLSGGCGGEVPGLFELHFTTGTADLFLRMGETRTFSLGAGHVIARNLRSFIEGYCNDNVNWAHWVANAGS